MLTPVEFLQWCRHLQLSAATRELIQTLRTSPPARAVRGRGHNVHGSYPSRKMEGRRIPFESHTLELSAIYLLEHDPAVLELYGQPTRLHLRYQNKQGRTIAPRHVPDFLVLRPDGATLEEWKYEQTLLRLAEQYPQRYQRTETGGWHCPPGEAAAAALGLGYRLRSSAELTPHFIGNLAFLEDYVLVPAPVPEASRARILARVKAEPGITLAALLAEEAGLRAHEVYALVAQDQLYADLAATSLTFHWRVALFLDQETADTHTLLHQPDFPTRRASATPFALASDTRLLWEGRPWRLVNLGETHTTLLPETGPPMQVPTAFFQQLLEAGTITALTATQEVPAHQEAKERLAQASPADLREANRRFRLVQAYLHHREDLYEGVTTRTLRRWSASFREAQLTSGEGYVGLLPRTHQRGNRLPKAPEAARTKLDAYIAEHFETASQTPAWAVYVAYQRACEQDQVTPLSARTFYRRIKQRAGPEQTTKRKGARAAYPETPWYPYLERSTPRHGDRPFALVHLDHTPLDIELRASATGRVLGRPWATLLLDAFSRRVLAIYLTFDPPSYRSCMMALRICVQRFGRFPAGLMVDSGKEFQSVSFESMLMHYGCLLKIRPAHEPRFGSVIERFFGTTHTEFIYTLLGNTQASKQPRFVTKAVDPKRLAVWTLGELYRYLCEWTYEVYDQMDHPALGQSPRQAFLQGLALFGEREQRHIEYDEAFLMATRPTTHKETAWVEPGRGIRLHGIYYSHEVLRHPEVEKTRVPVRFDPFNIGVASAYVQGRWVECLSQYYRELCGHSEKERELASQEIRRQGQVHQQQRVTVTAKRLAEFLAQTQTHQGLLLQQLRDQEARQIHQVIAGQMASGLSEEPAEAGDSQPAHAPRVPRAQARTPLDLTTLPIFEVQHE